MIRLFMISVGSEQSTFQIPSVAKPASSSVIRNFEVFAKFRKTSGLSSNSHNFISARVACLLKSCFPSYIFGEISLVIINPSKRQSERSFTQIFQKIGEGICPPLADNNSPSSVTLESFIFRVLTSVFHGIPAMKGWRRKSPPCMSMFVSLAKKFMVQATTGTCVSDFQRFVANGNFFSAITNTSAGGIPVSSRAYLYSGF